MDKKVKIANCNIWSDYYKEKPYVEVSDIWYSPDKKYAVIEYAKGETYIAISVDDFREDILFGTYIDSCEHLEWKSEMRSYSVTWYMEYGFVKLCYFDLGTGQSGTEKRFYFDRELYYQKYEEENHVPKNKKN